VDATYNLNKSEIDISDRGSGAYSDFLPGRKSGSIDLTVNWDLADAQLQVLVAAYFADTKLDFRWRFDTVGSEVEYTSEGYVMDMPFAGPGEDKCSVSLTLRLTGTVTPATQ